MATDRRSTVLLIDKSRWWMDQRDVVRDVVDVADIGDVAGVSGNIVLAGRKWAPANRWPG